MSSETASEPSSFIENLINARNRDISLLFPYIFGLNASNPLEQEETQGIPRGSPDRIILINPLTQGMLVIERSSSNNSSDGTSSGLDSFFSDLFSSKSGRPPASKASIDAMASVEIVEGENDDDQCVICLEEWEAGAKAKEMPCKHRFHGDCIEKWLKIHGSCPVCRYEMPVEEGGDDEKRRGDGERRRGVWVNITFGFDRRRSDNDQTDPSEGNDALGSDQELQE